MPASGKITRRDMAICTVLAACSVTSTASFADGPTSDPLPNPTKFKSGDFVWPKKRGVYIPYKSGSRNDPKEDERKWIAERDRFVSEASKTAPDLRGPDLEYLRTFSLFQSFTLGTSAIRFRARRVCTSPRVASMSDTLPSLRRTHRVKRGSLRR